MKQLMINCSTCDLRFVKEETLAKYERLTVNAAQIITSQETNQLLAAYHVSMNSARMDILDRDVKFSTVNGKASISAKDADNVRKALTVNGKLEIMPDAAPALASYVSILVNGKMTYPDNLEGLLGCVTVNGKRVSYPAGAIVLPDDTKIDRIFALRAKNALYYAPELLFLDGTLDVDGLAAKGVRFEAKNVIVAEALVEKLLPMLPETAEIAIVPDGAAYVDDDAELKESLVRRYGSKLYIDGDLTIGKEGENALAQLTYLHVNGTVKLDMDLQEAFYRLNAEYDELKLVDNNIHYITDGTVVAVTAAMLKKYPGGVAITDCAKVVIDEDVTADMLKNLQIEDTAVVCCAKAIMPEVMMLSSDVASFSPLNEEEKEEDEDEDKVTINTATCTL